MKGKSIVLLVVAMGCGLVAMLGVQQALSQKQDGEPEMVSVLVAVTDIRSGIPLDDKNTVFREFPKESIPEGAVTSSDQVQDRSLKSSAVAGEIIMLPKLGEKGDLRASAEIPEGYRVVTVSVNATTTHAGQMAPDDRVDVMLTYDYRNTETRETRTKSRTILQNIPVFSVDNKRERSGDLDEVNAKNVSLLVTLDQAQLVMLAMNKGKLHLAMRPKSDDSELPTMAIDDSVFDEWDSNQVAQLSNPPAEDPTPADDAEAIRRALLEEQESQAAASAVPPTVAETIPAAVPTTDMTTVTSNDDPETALWEITIYAGKNKKTESFEIPADELEPATLDLNRFTAPNRDWKQWLQKVL